METLFLLLAALITLIALARSDGAIHARRPDDGSSHVRTASTPHSHLPSSVHRNGA
jgi:hypothetical protein